MSPSTTREVEHEITITAPAATVYELLADVQNWPQIFPPTIYVDMLEGGSATEERIQIWATANGGAKSWTSRRRLDHQSLRIDFHQEVSAPPVAAMTGAWQVEPLSEDESRLRLLHAYRAVDDDPAGLAWIDEAVDRNSRSELAALKRNVERVPDLQESTFSFEDVVRVNGSAEDVYDFLDRADLWGERLPHVAKVRLEEPAPGLQTLEMDTQAKDGSTHTTKSYRVTFPNRRIAYKQVTLPALMSLHTGCWALEDQGEQVVVSSQHTVVLNTDNIASVLGPDATIAEARQYVRDALSTNSRKTLNHARAYAEHSG